jgi:hypothetical protein
MAMGISMVAGGAGRLCWLGLTHSFFAEATAWTSVAWGVLFLYGDLLLSTRRFIVADTELKIQIPSRLGRTQTLGLDPYLPHGCRGLTAATPTTATAKFKSTTRLPGEIAIEREEYGDLDPGAGSPHHRTCPSPEPDSQAARLDLNSLPFGKSALFTWKR